ncbi:MAG: DUF2059 domain-containing protein [Beijerinckiaceae bacterium]
MRLFVAVLAALFLLLGAIPRPASATDLDPKQFDEKLKAYDPALVEAARTYQRTIGMTDQVTKALPMVTGAVARQVKQQTPALNDEQVKEFTDAFQSAFIDDTKLLEQASALIVLEVFDKDEITALNQFYQSPIGQRVGAKMPQLLGRKVELTTFMHSYIFPDAIGKARDELKKKGVDVN